MLDGEEKKVLSLSKVPARPTNHNKATRKKLFLATESSHHKIKLLSLAHDRHVVNGIMFVGECYLMDHHRSVVDTRDAVADILARVLGLFHVCSLFLSEFCQRMISLKLCFAHWVLSPLPTEPRPREELFSVTAGRNEILSTINNTSQPAKWLSYGSTHKESNTRCNMSRVNIKACTLYEL